MTATNQPRALREIIVECLRITTDRDPVVSFYLPKGWELLEAALAAYVREREAAVREKASLIARTIQTEHEVLDDLSDERDKLMWADGYVVGSRDAAVRIAAIPLPSDEATPPITRDDHRCAVCGWPMAEYGDDGCVPGNCSMRPRPTQLYDPERARKEDEATP